MSFISVGDELSAGREEATMSGFNCYSNQTDSCKGSSFLPGGYYLEHVLCK